MHYLNRRFVGGRSGLIFRTASTVGKSLSDASRNLKPGNKRKLIEASSSVVNNVLGGVPVKAALSKGIKKLKKNLTIKNRKSVKKSIGGSSSTRYGSKKKRLIKRKKRRRKKKKIVKKRKLKKKGRRKKRKKSTKKRLKKGKKSRKRRKSNLKKVFAF